MGAWGHGGMGAWGLRPAMPRGWDTHTQSAHPCVYRAACDQTCSPTSVYMHTCARGEAVDRDQCGGGYRCRVSQVVSHHARVAALVGGGGAVDDDDEGGDLGARGCSLGGGGGTERRLRPKRMGSHDEFKQEEAEREALGRSCKAVATSTATNTRRSRVPPSSPPARNNDGIASIPLPTALLKSRKNDERRVPVPLSCGPASAPLSGKLSDGKRRSTRAVGHDAVRLLLIECAAIAARRRRSGCTKARFLGRTCPRRRGAKVGI